MVLTKSGRVQLSFPLLCAGLVSSLSALSLANEHSNNISLRLLLGDKVVDLMEEWKISRQLLSAAAWQFLKAGRYMDILNRVTEMELQDACVEALLPPAVADACPNLVTLTFTNCAFELVPSNPRCFTTVLPRLRELVIYTDTDCLDPPSWEPRMRQQLQRLTALDTLNICLDGERDWTTDELLWEYPCAVASQLTYLRMEDERHDSTEYLRLQPQLFTALKQLHIGHQWFTDAGMEVLLAMPSLTHLSVLSFHLQSSYAGRACRWQEVTCSYPSCEALGQLPLHADLVLKGCDCLRLDLPLSTAQQAVANIAKCKDVGRLGEVHIDFNGEVDAASVLPLWQQTVLLMKATTSLAQPSSILSGPLVDSLVEYLHGRSTFKLSIYDVQNLEQRDLYARLVKALPRHSTLRLGHTHLDEALLAQCIDAAEHELTIEWLDCMAKEAYALISANMPPHVTLETLNW